LGFTSDQARAQQCQIRMGETWVVESLEDVEKARIQFKTEENGVCKRELS